MIDRERLNSSYYVECNLEMVYFLDRKDFHLEGENGIIDRRRKTRRIYSKDFHLMLLAMWKEYL